MRSFFENNEIDEFEIGFLEKNINKMSSALLKMNAVDRNTINARIVEAATSGDLVTLKSLVGAIKQAGFNINFSDNPDGNTTDGRYIIRSPLLEAVQKGHKEVVGYLLNQNIHVEQQISPFGKNTALTTAIKYNQKEIALMILNLSSLSSKFLKRKNAENLNANEMAKEKGWDHISDKIIVKMKNAMEFWDSQRNNDHELVTNPHNQTENNHCPIV